MKLLGMWSVNDKEFVRMHNKFCIYLRNVYYKAVRIIFDVGLGLLDGFGNWSWSKVFSRCLNEINMWKKEAKK